MNEGSQIVMAGECVTFTSGDVQRSFTVALPGGELARLRETLRKVRPTGHDYLCEHGPDGPDVWVDQTEDDAFAREHMRPVKWVAGIGFVDDPDRPEEPSYVGWCCLASTQRHVIDESLGESVSGETKPEGAQ